MGRPKTYNVNESYFNMPLNEKKAYFLGLILSDGHLNYNRGCFQYACKKDDVELIHFMKNELGSTHPIKEYQIKENWYVRFNITNKSLVTTLIEKFDLPKLNKSNNNLLIPKNIPPDILHHFLRGLFDGDGSIWTSSKKEDYCFSYSGGENLMLELKQIFHKTLKLNGHISYRYSKENRNSCGLSYHGNLVTSIFFNYLYKDATCFLKRKHKKFEMCNEISKKTTLYRFDGSEEKIKKLYLQGISQKNISDKLNLVYSSVRCCVQRLRKSGNIT